MHWEKCSLIATVVEWRRGECLVGIVCCKWAQQFVVGQMRLALRVNLSASCLTTPFLPPPLSHSPSNSGDCPTCLIRYSRSTDCWYCYCGCCCFVVAGGAATVSVMRWLLNSPTLRLLLCFSFCLFFFSLCLPLQLRNWKVQVRQVASGRRRRSSSSSKQQLK